MHFVRPLQAPAPCGAFALMFPSSGAFFLCRLFRDWTLPLPGLSLKVGSRTLALGLLRLPPIHSALLPLLDPFPKQLSWHKGKLRPSEGASLSDPWPHGTLSTSFMLVPLRCVWKCLIPIWPFDLCAVNRKVTINF